jgi:hypothetical protein
MLAKYVAQVFYVLDTTNKRLKVVIPGKRWIIRVKNAIDEEEFDQFDEIPPFVTSMIKPKIPSANEALYLCNDHHEKAKNFKKLRLQWKVGKWLYKICSMCENMIICVKIRLLMDICVKIWLLLDICVRYAQCLKIWQFLWKCDSYLIFVWNMLNVWKYDHLMSLFCLWSMCSFWSLVFSFWWTLN